MIGKLWKMNEKAGRKAHSHRNLANFQDRRNICNWTDTADFKSKYSMGVCGHRNQCPSLSNARAGFHVRGDTFSANRLFDTLLSGTVPIFTLDEHFSSHHSFIDWKKLVYFIRLGEGGSNETSFRRQIDVILSGEKKLEEKTRDVVANRDLFDWDTLVPFDAYMYMFQAHLWPETRVNSSKYSGIILPPQKNTITK